MIRAARSLRATATVWSPRALSTMPALAPPFTFETATAKVKKAQDLWNSMDPERVSLAYTECSIWRNRDQFFQGRKAIVDFLSAKWEKETNYCLRKQLHCFMDNRIAVNFWYEYYDTGLSSWRRTYGLEHWNFDAEGLMSKRHCSANEISIKEEDRWFKEGVDPDSIVIHDVDG
ncbi:hypothetical protein BCR35DRAFT_308041 [Leucosporidium creatinivorum]|uniref:DUF1348-domain-containing protein n=1 Tax=Leucosporidium creatinivorum TaxID=106004 RepID=A0A1Y2ED02_9BASI|nr:hypothetical protein BCR35DRAFT_308041 [Leucosporidium creatinivorum]